MEGEKEEAWMGLGSIRGIRRMLGVNVDGIREGGQE